ncbi:beta-mannosidase [Prevotella sp. E13-17]|uniref:glycoside hydrolase family 2 protein n=1 Tax=Prevotella sp. E13-17 TaxID=2913616 RepID=UPI001EDA2345|nr:beta-mannosidase [Prevotella sp. E13-17]UKK51043.1 beta-mannosidase [Prevotella sp. E13-17]
MKNIIVAIVCSLMSSLYVVAQVRVMSLNSDDKQVVWHVAPQDEVKAKGQEVSSAGYTFDDDIMATVPGVVFADYVNAGREKNPDVADHIYRVDETKYSRPYWYRTEFCGMTLEEGQHVWLCFDNTNRYADFYFNGHKISGTEESTKDVSGHMLRSRFDVTSYYKSNDKNAIAVLIYDVDQKKTRKDEGPYGVACSPSYLAAAGWDWMPYVPGRLAGITGHARIEITGDVVMNDPWIRSFLPSNQQAELSVSSELRNLSSEKKKVVVEGVIQPGNIRFQKTVEINGGETQMLGINHHDAEALLVNQPKLWWPNGYGEPNLYTCQLRTIVDGQQTDVRSFRFGIKKYEYRIEKNAVGMPVLIFYVNGQRVFVKGGNWGMSEYLLRMHGAQYELPIRLHREMNYNMIRLWTGCVTDDEFYDYCDEYGIMVWNDFWLYVAWNDVAEHEAFKVNARDKVRRLRNHPSIALWCGANETHPVADIDQALRMIVMEEDANDRLYTSCSNQDAKSGSGWWKDMPPRHHFETSASNLAFNTPSYPYGYNYGYGCRSEIGMATFPTFESVREFIPEKDWWPLPTDEQLEKDDDTMWNKHFFGKEAWNGGPIDYKKSVNERYGASETLEAFCEKAQLINLEDMKGMYEAWNDKMWNDASALLIWMSHPAYPSFVWQTYDYYYDPTGCYWGAKQACEPHHVQWNCLTNSVKVINATSTPLEDVIVTARIYDINGKEVPALTKTKRVPLVEASNVKEAFVLSFADDDMLSPVHFIRLELTHREQLLSQNFYWRNGENELDYRALLTLPEAKLKTVVGQPLVSEQSKYTTFNITLTNISKTVAFANRLRVVNSKTGERVLPAIMSDGYVTLMPGEQRTLRVEVPNEMMANGLNILVKQFNQKERMCAQVKYKNKR